jgi:rhodanese-related sulfurtransferase
MEFPSIAIETLKEKLDRGDRLQLTDIRPNNAYSTEHIRYAQNLPFEEIDDHAQELLAPGDPIVVYGEDDRDLMTERAAEEFVARGFDPGNILLFRDGIVGWRAAGYFTSSGDEPMA